MKPSLLQSYLSLLPILTTLTTAQSPSSTGSGYTGYDLSLTGDPDSVIYSTSNTNPNAPTYPPPDVYLNASVHVGEISIDVSNLTAKINLDAQVLSLLQFNAGVDLSIDRVALIIQNVTAKVLLEARLENLVLMINDTLDSLDLNPTLATLGQAVNSTVGGLTGGGGSSSSGGSGSGLTPRSYELENNILYSINDYTGNTHTNRILTQSGDIIDQSLGNDGNIYNEQVVGSYARDMTFTGSEVEVVRDGKTVREREYIYAPFNGLSVISAVYVDGEGEGEVLATRVISESGGGGSSTVGGPGRD